jgi:hypothetical protein
VNLLRKILNICLFDKVAAIGPHGESCKLQFLLLGLKRVGKGGGGVWITFHNENYEKPFHDSRVLKKQFHGKLDSNKII